MNSVSPVLGTAALSRAIAPAGDTSFSVECSRWFAPDNDGAEQLLAEAVIPEWEALALKTHAVPFLRPAYVSAWWRAFSVAGSRLVLWQARRHGRLVALLPMMQTGNTLRTATNYHTPQTGIIADSDEAAAALLHALLQNANVAQVVLAGLDTLSRDPAICRQAVRDAGHRLLALPHERATYVTTQQGWQAYGKKLGKEFRAEIRRTRRRLEEQGTLTVEFGNGDSQLDARLEEALAVEAAGWKQRNGTSIQSSPREARFYRDLAHWAARENMLRLCFLRLDGNVIAMMFAFENQQQWHLLKTGYDEAYARFSAGKLMLHDCLQHCFETGMQRIEIHGDAAPHKMRWRPNSRVLERLHIFPPTLAGRFAWARVALRPALKALLIRCHLLRAPPPIPDADN
ncbi:MAG: GNAT family N-acetyltransferase [Pseudomonadota bacterium]